MPPIKIKHEHSEHSLVDGDDDYISSDSSFYGSSPHRAHLQHLSDTFSPEEHRSASRPTLAALAYEKISNPPPSAPTAELYNPYAGLLHARQLSEHVPAFLVRLPSLTTPASTIGPWIHIANPYSQRRPTDEDRASFTAEAEPLLADFVTCKTELEKTLSGTKLTRALTPLRSHLSSAILARARTHNLTSGKWLLFPMPENVNAVWESVAIGTASGQLGIGAKVGSDEGKGRRIARVCCVYTADFADEGDVRRVLEGLVERGLVGRRYNGAGEGGERGIYYKCDAFTHLGINSGNEWGLSVSMYSSKEMLASSKRKHSA
ncbi:hypothetical protein MMC14_008152 [Varicellaria rhodocarpa]|nr:hypothetical protein [Varicellaria rhodocarpa]